MTIKEGDVLRYNGQVVKVTSINYRDNGYGIVYLDGPKRGWEDWVVNRDNFQKLRTAPKE